MKKSFTWHEASYWLFASHMTLHQTLSLVEIVNIMFLSKPVDSNCKFWWKFFFSRIAEESSQVSNFRVVKMKFNIYQENSTFLPEI